MAKNKNFEDLQEGDPFFILKPYTHEVHQTTVKSSFLHPKTKNGQVWVIEFYIALTIGISLDRLKEAEKNDPNLKVTQIVYLQKGQEQAIIMVKPAPTLVSTSKESIDAWLRTMNPTDFQEYLELQMLLKTLKH